MVKAVKYLFVGVMLLAAQAWAADVTVSDVWARASAGGAGGAGAVFLTINNGGAADRLVAASTPVAAMAELHTHMEMNGVMTMRKIDEIIVPAGQSIVLQPGGLHIMLMNMTAALKEGDTFPLTLTFDKAGTVNVTAKVGGVAAMGEHHHMMDMSH